MSFFLTPGVFGRVPSAVTDNSPFSAVQAYFQSLARDPVQLGIRAGLTVVVLVIALSVGPWLGRRASREAQRAPRLILIARAPKRR